MDLDAPRLDRDPIGHLKSGLSPKHILSCHYHCSSHHYHATAPLAPFPFSTFSLHLFVHFLPLFQTPLPSLMEESYSSNCHNLSLTPTTANSTTTSSAPSSSSAPPHDYDVVVILAAMICALVCALGLNSMLQCIVRCTRRTLTEPAGWVASRRHNAGLKREHVVALPISTFASATSTTSSPQVGCPICLSEFSDGEKVRVLPACSHRFHVRCIDTWLLSHCSCPTCRNRLTAAAQGSEVPLEVVTTS